MLLHLSAVHYAEAGCYVWYLIQQKTLTSSPLLSTVLHACDVGINMDGHEHGHGESRINKKKN